VKITHARRPRRAGRSVTTAAALAAMLFLVAAGLASPAMAAVRDGRQEARITADGAGRVRFVVSPVPGQRQASAPVPTVTGPIPGAIPASGGGGVAPVSSQVLAASSYRQSEFFVSGTASAYNFVGPPGADGRWTVSTVPGSAAAYKTRIEVFTPADPARFSGHVIVEWDNVTAGADGMPDLTMTHPDVFRAGDVYVGVSAQFVGVRSAALSDPARYGSLTHPGDSYAYDIFSQAGMAIRADAAQILPGLVPHDITAAGESQSAFELTTYVDGFAPLFNVYDGYLINSRTASGDPLQQAPAPATVLVNGTPESEPDGNTGLSTVSTPPIAQTRTDLRAPVLTYLTQTDVYSPPSGLLGYGPATQADSADFRLWEAAGTAHADDCLVNLCANDRGDAVGAIARFNDMLTPPTNFGGLATCDTPINTGDMGYTLSTALQQLTRWAATGGAPAGIPAASPPLFAGQSAGENAATIPVLDTHGNIIGGVRSPAVDVPVATLAGTVNSPDFCELAGTTTPFTTTQLDALYPTHAAFVRAWTADVARLTVRGYLTPVDASDLIAAAAVSTVP
jgi:Alpha/beta hydrolase domain